MRVNQIWQWIYHGATLSDGRKVTPELFDEVLADEMKSLRETLGEERWTNGHFEQAVSLFSEMTKAQECEEFLTLPAYRLILENEA